MQKSPLFQRQPSIKKKEVVQADAEISLFPKQYYPNLPTGVEVDTKIQMLIREKGVDAVNSKKTIRYLQTPNKCELINNPLWIESLRAEIYNGKDYEFVKDRINTLSFQAREVLIQEMILNPYNVFRTGPEIADLFIVDEEPYLNVYQLTAYMMTSKMPKRDLKDIDKTKLNNWLIDLATIQTDEEGLPLLRISCLMSGFSTGCKLEVPIVDPYQMLENDIKRKTIDERDNLFSPSAKSLPEGKMLIDCIVNCNLIDASLETFKQKPMTNCSPMCRLNHSDNKLYHINNLDYMNQDHLRIVIGYLERLIKETDKTFPISYMYTAVNWMKLSLAEGPTLSSFTLIVQRLLQDETLIKIGANMYSKNNIKDPTQLPLFQLDQKLNLVHKMLAPIAINPKSVTSYNGVCVHSKQIEDKPDALNLAKITRSVDEAFKAIDKEINWAPNYTVKSDPLRSMLLLLMEILSFSKNNSLILIGSIEFQIVKFLLSAIPKLELIVISTFSIENENLIGLKKSLQWFQYSHASDLEKIIDIMILFDKRYHVHYHNYEFNTSNMEALLKLKKKKCVKELTIQTVLPENRILTDVTFFDVKQIIPLWIDPKADEIVLYSKDLIIGKNKLNLNETKIKNLRVSNYYRSYHFTTHSKIQGYDHCYDCLTEFIIAHQFFIRSKCVSMENIDCDIKILNPRFKPDAEKMDIVEYSAHVKNLIDSTVSNMRKLMYFPGMDVDRGLIMVELESRRRFQLDRDKEMKRIEMEAKYQTDVQMEIPAPVKMFAVSLSKINKFKNLFVPTSQAMIDINTLHQKANIGDINIVINTVRTDNTQYVAIYTPVVFWKQDAILPFAIQSEQCLSIKSAKETVTTTFLHGQMDSLRMECNNVNGVHNYKIQNIGPETNVSHKIKRTAEIMAHRIVYFRLSMEFYESMSPKLMMDIESQIASSN